MNLTFKQLVRSAPEELQDILWKQWNAPQNKIHHPEGNTLKHIMTVVNRALIKFPNNMNIIMAAFFHDLGKFASLGWKNGVPTQHGHEKISADLVLKYAYWVEYWNANVEAVHYIVENHMKIKPNVWDVMRDSKKKVITDNPYYKDLIAFGTIDKGGLLMENVEHDIIKEIYPKGIMMPNGSYQISSEYFDVIIRQDEYGKYEVLSHDEDDEERDEDGNVIYYEEEKNLSLEELIDFIEERFSVEPVRWKASNNLRDANNKTGMLEENMLNEAIEEDFSPALAPDMSGNLKTKDNIERFIFAGKAIFTIRNNETGNRFTFRIMQAKKNDNVHFVSMMTGPINYSHYSFFGTIFDKTRFKLSAKSKLDPSNEKDVMGVKAFQWFFNTLLSQTNEFPEKVQIWHEGVCGKCGKKLTVPESVDIGLGPICARNAELWQRTKRIVQTNNKTGIFDSFKFKHLKTFEGFIVLDGDEDVETYWMRNFEEFENEEISLTVYKHRKVFGGGENEVHKFNNPDELVEAAKKFLEGFPEADELAATDVYSGRLILKIERKKVLENNILANAEYNIFNERQPLSITEEDIFELFMNQKIQDVADYIYSFQHHSYSFIKNNVIVYIELFENEDEALNHLKAKGYSISRTQAHAPIAAAHRDRPIDIPKWRTLTSMLDIDKEIDAVIVKIDGNLEKKYAILYFNFKKGFQSALKIGI